MKLTLSLLTISLPAIQFVDKKQRSQYYDDENDKKRLKSIMFDKPATK